MGLGTANYFLEKYDDSVAAFLRADKLDGGSGRAISYLGATQVDSAAGPVPAAVDAICSRADSHATESAAVTWCGAVLFRKAFLAGDQAAAPAAIRRLRVAVKLAPDEPVANCTLGYALEWTEQMTEARRWLEICVAVATQLGRRSLSAQPRLPKFRTQASGCRTSQPNRKLRLPARSATGNHKEVRS